VDVEEVVGGLTGGQVTPGRLIGQVGEGPEGPIRSKLVGLGRPSMSEEFLFFAGSIEPLLHGNELRGVEQWMREWEASRGQLVTVQRPRRRSLPHRPGSENFRASPRGQRLPLCAKKWFTLSTMVFQAGGTVRVVGWGFLRGES
jgi:hypothetical protein